MRNTAAQLLFRDASLHFTTDHTSCGDDTVITRISAGRTPGDDGVITDIRPVETLDMPLVSDDRVPLADGTTPSCQAIRYHAIWTGIPP